MATTNSIDFLIVGFGLAGGLLAWELIQRGCRVVVVDDGEVGASQVAAGLINPVTGLRFVKTADVEVLLPAAKACYADLAQVFGRPFYLEKPLLRVLRSAEDVDRCRKRFADPAYRDYLQGMTPAADAVLGVLRQKQTGHLLTQPLLSCLQTYLQSAASYRQARFDYGEMRFSPFLQWRDLWPSRIVFCEGYRVAKNPWFSWLPMRPAKGEILTLEHALPIPDEIVNDGHWLLPIGAGQVRIGATFDRDRIDRQITDAAHAELIAAGERLFPGLQNAKPIRQAAGVRPYSADRQPLLGQHPRLQHLYVFNGFGAKGSMMIPWHCRRFADHLLNGEVLPPSCAIARYAKMYFSG